MALLSRVLNHHSDKSGRRSRSSSLQSNSGSTSPSIRASRTRTNSIQHLNGNGLTNTNDPSFSLSINLESPPIVLYGQPHESTGSIISGILKLDIKQIPDTLITNDNNELRSFESVTIALVQTVKYSKPFMISAASIQSCRDCNYQKTTLARWDVLTSTCSFPSGTHAYPFSHLIPGSLPASSKLGSVNASSFIKYELIAIAKRPNTKQTTLILPVRVTRSILRGPDRNSLRVFPPTEITASAVLPNVIYPKSSFPIELKLNNIVSANGDRRWRMRKLTWRIEELVKIRLSVCELENHQLKLKFCELAQKKLKTKDSSSNPTFHNKSNVHHSTIQTNVSMQRDPVITGSHVPNDLVPIDSNVNPENSNVDTIVHDDIVDNDMEGNIRSGPSHAHENFMEDFGVRSNGNNNDLEPSVSTHSNVLDAGETEDANAEHLYVEELRTISHGDFKSGWKSDFSDRGKIELVADISASNFDTGLNNHISRISSDSDKDLIDPYGISSRNGSANVCCDIEDPTLGVYVSHTLVVEVIVAEEIIQSNERRQPRKSNSSNELTTVPSTSSVSSIGRSYSSSSTTTPATPSAQPKTPQMGVPTGAARVLRMQFKLCLTERSGLGIAWDDEVPPTYEDVRTLSPPNYHENSSNPSTPTYPRSTPNILYGVGDTPIVGSFGLNRSTPSTLTIDGMIDLDERIQEFSL
ncbi:hypothetical protein DFJ63DRAFT_288170 [Scheffersomyces coipomensis]|uniref:uncharacterized protein n=1 Tax=Scheffersomyces coipomensis TaxID=1788519 RepID=UPI00315DA7C7